MKNIFKYILRVSALIVFFTLTFFTGLFGKSTTRDNHQKDENFLISALTPEQVHADIPPSDGDDGSSCDSGSSDSGSSDDC